MTSITWVSLIAYQCYYTLPSLSCALILPPGPPYLSSRPHLIHYNHPLRLPPQPLGPHLALHTFQGAKESHKPTFYSWISEGPSHRGPDDVLDARPNHKPIVESVTGQMTNYTHPLNAAQAPGSCATLGPRHTNRVSQYERRMTSREEIIQRGKTGIAKSKIVRIRVLGPCWGV